MTETPESAEVPYWFPVESIAEYWDLPYAEVRDELQKSQALGVVGGFLSVEAKSALVWTDARFGLQAASKMLDDLASLAVELPFEAVQLTEEYDLDTDYDRPILL